MTDNLCMIVNQPPWVIITVVNDGMAHSMMYDMVWRKGFKTCKCFVVL